MAAGSLPRSSSPSVLEAEAKATREGLSFARELGFQDLEVESDNVTVVKLIKKEALSLRSVSSVIYDINQLALDFQFVAFSNLSRICNMPAHLLGKFGLNSNSDLFWIEKSLVAV